MIRTLVIGLVTATAMAITPATALLAAEPEAKPHTVACLKKAAEMHQAKTALGQLAGDRGANPRIRQFGLQLASAHKKLSEEVQGLATTKGVPLSSELNDEHKQKVKEFSQLSGHAFDREYMAYILRDHQNSANEFEEHLQAVEDLEVLHWIARTLPLLRAHVEEARGLKYAMQTTPLTKIEEVGGWIHGHRRVPCEAIMTITAHGESPLLALLRSTRHCRHRRMIDDILTPQGAKTGQVRCIECGAIFDDPTDSVKEEVPLKGALR